MWISKNKFYRLNTRIIVLEREVERLRECLEYQLIPQTEKKKILDEKITKLQEMLDGMGSEPGFEFPPTDYEII